MTFWLNVALCYALLLGLGLALGAYLGARGRRDGFGPGDDDAPVPVGPLGPTFTLEFPPLGSAFDRALLPGAFEDESASTRV